MENHHLHHHEHDVCAKSINYLIFSFVINLLLSIFEIAGGIISGSISLIADALHNTSDAFSILIAVIAFKIGNKKANKKFTYGFKRAETIGGFINLILLFISGCYVLMEGIKHLIIPNNINGSIITYISIIALIIDVMTAKLSHHGSQHNSNMRMVFLHNLSDALGSVGVTISGIFAMYFNVHIIDSIIAILLATYMIYQSVISFSKIVNILMNATPNNLDIDEIIDDLNNLTGVRDIHHIHVWNINENDVSFECHVVSNNFSILNEIKSILKQKYNIIHSNIQIENNVCGHCFL